MSNLFGLNFFEGDKKFLIKNITEGKKSSIFTPNIDHIIKINQNSRIFNQYSKGDYIIADGWPIAMCGKLKKLKIQRITGVDLMDDLLEYANYNRKSIFFLGCEDRTLEILMLNIKEKYKNIDNIGFNNGFFEDDELVIEKINKNKTNILFVGMGCPKQETWIIKNREKLNCNIMIGVGGAFKIYSKEVKRAPKVVQYLGIEWFYRFLKEPRRLFRRYFIDYLKFIPLFLKEIILQREN
ncbi:WecB/TagA/CpsF family glycosyltransferase [Clostridium perfringens]